MVSRGLPAWLACNSGSGDSLNADLRFLQVYLPTEPRSWVIIAAATAASIVLLWLLFGADVGKKVGLHPQPSQALSLLTLGPVLLLTMQFRDIVMHAKTDSMLARST